MPHTDPDTSVPNTRTPDAAPLRAMIVGAPKAGTTSLYRYVAQHPAVACHAQREMSYFFSDEEFAQGPACWSGKYFQNLSPGAVPFAKHVFTMYRGEALSRLRSSGPDVHVIALLRDPVRRAYSSYWYSRRRGWDPVNRFDAAVEWELKQIESDGDAWLADRDRMHLRVGVYHQPITSLMEVFGRERVHVFLTDDLAQDAAGLCRQVFELLGVDTGFVPDLTRTHNPIAAARSQVVARTVAGALKSKGRVKRTVRRFVPHTIARRARHALLRMNEKSFDPPSMPDETRRRLVEYFAPHNEALSRLIGRSLSAWSAP